MEGAGIPKMCPMDALLRLLMGPWTIHILYVLGTGGPTRFGVLKRLIPGISSRMLTERLRMLEKARVVHRHYEPTVPPQVTYSLTTRGEDLGQVLDELHPIAERWMREDAHTEVPPSTEYAHASEQYTSRI